MELTSSSTGKIIIHLPYGVYYIKKPVTLFDYSEKSPYIALNLTTNSKSYSIINKDPLNDPNNSTNNEFNDGLDDSNNFEENNQDKLEEIEKDEIEEEGSQNEPEQNNQNNGPTPNNGLLTGTYEENKELENENQNSDSESQNSANTNKKEDKKEIEENSNNNSIQNDLLGDNENESNLNNFLNQEMECDYERIEVELGATDQSILSCLFYITSALGLFIIKYVK